MYSKKTYQNPETPRAVHFFQYYPSNFLRLYGLADDAPPKATIFKRINPRNCELLIRPKVGVSEFAGTITENLQYLAESESSLINNDQFRTTQQKLSSLVEALQKLNTTNEAGNANAHDVKTFLKAMLGADQTQENFFQELTKLGAAMFSMGIHYTVMHSLLSNPEWLAEQSVGTTQQLKAFKQNPTIPGLKKYLTDTCVAQENQTKTKTTSTKRKLLQLLESDEEEQEEEEQMQQEEEQTKQEERKHEENTKKRKKTAKKSKKSHN